MLRRCHCNGLAHLSREVLPLLEPHDAGPTAQPLLQTLTTACKVPKHRDVIPCNFLFASSNPNWDSDSRTLHGRGGYEVKLLTHGYVIPTSSSGQQDTEAP
jgi:hypothetical protein